METSSIPLKLSRTQNFRSARKLVNNLPLVEEKPEVQTKDTFSKMKSALKALKFIRYAKDVQTVSSIQN